MGVFEHGERMPDVGGLTANTVRDPATCGVCAGDRAEYRVVKRRIPDVRLLGEKVPRFAKERQTRVEHRPQDPSVEVRERNWAVVGDELASVCGVPPTIECTSTASRGSSIDQKRAASRYSNGRRTNSRLARPRNGALPASRFPMTDIADPHSNSRDPARLAYPRGPSACWIREGRDGLALLR